MKKMNNKGFSLVELIVVVLIMAIIAVALAPQVMKWVENSRKSTDVQNYGHVAEALEVAYAKEAVFRAGDAQVICNAGQWGSAQGYTPSAAAIAENDAALGIIDGSMIETLGSKWNAEGSESTMRMRSKKYCGYTDLFAAMYEGHLVRDDRVNDDVES